jgi:glycosyltransferase involved in cell wall biosynthesis
MLQRGLYIQYGNPGAYPPVEHSSRLLADNGWQVLCLGVAAHDTQALRWPSYPRIKVRLLPACPPGWRQKLHYVRFCLWVLCWALIWRPQLIYASDPLVCPVALLLSFFPGWRVLYHEHDSPGAGMHTTGSAVRRLVLQCRRRLARQAWLTILPNEQRARQFTRDLQPERLALTVWNCPRIDEVELSPTRPDPAILRVLYQGSIVPARLPDTVLKALSLLPPQVALHIIGYETIGSQGYVQQLREIACQLGIAERVVFRGSMPRSELVRCWRDYDVGLAVMPVHAEDENLTAMAGASNKAFDYLAGGLALLVTDLPAWHTMYVEPGYGLACNPNDPASIAAVLRWCREHPGEVRAMGERGRQRVLAEWNYETQFAPVLRMLQSGPLCSESIARRQRV